METNPSTHVSIETNKDIIAESDDVQNKSDDQIHAKRMWGNLRHIVGFASMIKPRDEMQTDRHELARQSSRRDSFLERFTVLRRGIPDSDGISSANSQTTIYNQLEKVSTDYQTIPPCKENELEIIDEESQEFSNNSYHQPVNGRPKQIHQFSDPSVDGISEMSTEVSIIKQRIAEVDSRCNSHFVIDPNGNCLLAWLTILTMAFLYNMWTLIARQTFRSLQSNYTNIWICFDIIADGIYLIDFPIQSCTSYLLTGLVVKNRSSLMKNYFKSKSFIIDLISVIPLDFVQFKINMHPLIRAPRFLKCYRANEWKAKIEDRSSVPNFWRIAVLLHLILLGCHWCGCIYYMLSEWEQFQNNWGYREAANSTGVSLLTRYTKCLYWAIICLTTIGIENPPETQIE